MTVCASWERPMKTTTPPLAAEKKKLGLYGVFQITTAKGLSLLERREQQVALGKLGGLVHSEAKRLANRENGRKGGLIKKPQQENRGPAQRAAPAPRSPQKLIETVIESICLRFGDSAIGLGDRGIRFVGVRNRAPKRNRLGVFFPCGAFSIGWARMRRRAWQHSDQHGSSDNQRTNRLR
jgi:hypothetical protein